MKRFFTQGRPWIHLPFVSPQTAMVWWNELGSSRRGSMD